MEYEVVAKKQPMMSWIFLLILICSTLPASPIPIKGGAWVIGVPDIVQVVIDEPSVVQGQVSRQHVYLAETLKRSLQNAVMQSGYRLHGNDAKVRPVVLNENLSMQNFLPDDSGFAIYSRISSSVDQVIGGMVESIGQRYVVTLYTIYTGATAPKTFFSEVTGPESFLSMLRGALKATVSEIRGEPVSSLVVTEVLQVPVGSETAELIGVEIDNTIFDPHDERLDLCEPGDHSIVLHYGGYEPLDLGHRQLAPDQIHEITPVELGEFTPLFGGFLTLSNDYRVNVSIQYGFETEQIHFIPTVGDGTIQGSMTDFSGSATRIFSLAHVQDQIDGNRLMLDAGSIMQVQSSGITTQGMVPFYASLTRSCLLLAPSILSYGMMEEHGALSWRLAFGASAFALSVSLIDTIFTVFDYYHSAR